MCHRSNLRLPTELVNSQLQKKFLYIEAILNVILIHILFRDNQAALRERQKVLQP